MAIVITQAAVDANTHNVGEAHRLHLAGTIVDYGVVTGITNGESISIRFYLTGESTPTLTTFADWAASASSPRALNVVLPAGVYDTDIANAGGTVSNKLIGCFKASPAPAMVSATPDPVAVGATVTVQGAGFSYLGTVTVRSLVGPAAFSPSVTVVSDSVFTFVMQSLLVTGQCSIVAEFPLITPDHDAILPVVFSPALSFSLVSNLPSPIGTPIGAFTDVVTLDPSGSDTLGAGTDEAPFTTFAHAFATTTGNVVIMLNGGVYTEHVVFPAGRTVRVIGRSMCYLDAQFAGTLMTLESAADSTTEPAHVFMENVKLRNPATALSIVNPTSGTYDPAVVNPDTGIGARIKDPSIILCNCEVYSDIISSATFWDIADANQVRIEFRKVTWFNLGAIVSSSTKTGNVDCGLVVRDSILDGFETVSPFYNVNTVDQITVGVEGFVITVSDSCYPGDGTVRDPLINAVPYVNAASVPPDLSLTWNAGLGANFKGQGSRGCNIGSEGFPVIGQLYHHGPGLLGGGLASADIWTNPVSGQGWIDTPGYRDGATKGLLIRHTVDPTNEDARRRGDRFTINKIDLPTATSGSLDSPVFKFRVKNGDLISTIRVIWDADEDESDASGSKDVVDSDAADTARTVLVRFQPGPEPFGQADVLPAFFPVERSVDVVGAFILFFADAFVQFRVIIREDGL